MRADVCDKPQIEKEGSLRLITLNEIAMAKRLYGNNIAWNRVWIHCDSYFPFGFQSKKYAMAPNGELWFRKEMYRDDFSCILVSIEYKHTFIHELGHVWQHQQGQYVRLRGLMSWAAEYYYDLKKGKLTDYTLEQQASILSDYWLLLEYGIDYWLYYRGKGLVRYKGLDYLNDIPKIYRKIVEGSFL